MKKYLPLLIFLSFIISGCEAKKDYSLVGSWQGVGDDGTSQILNFKENGTAEWILKTAVFSDTFFVKYKLDKNFQPFRMDIFDFQKGFLKDKTLYFIYEFENVNSLKLDAEAGTSDSVRPASFTGSTIVYKKLE